MSEESRHGETCIICEEKKDAGIHIQLKFICLQCERKIVAATASDPEYKEYVKKLKSLHTPPLYS